jgi:hypothetical protein
MVFCAPLALVVILYYLLSFEVVVTVLPSRVLTAQRLIRTVCPSRALSSMLLLCDLRWQ